MPVPVPRSRTLSPFFILQKPERRTASIPKVLTTSPVSFDIGDYVEVFVRIVGALVPGKGLKIYLM